MLTQTLRKVRLAGTVTILAGMLLIGSCQKPPVTDMRSLAPADSFAFAEIFDLKEAVASLAKDTAGSKLKNVPPNIQAAIVVSGFETTEQEAAEGVAILNFKPRFAMILDTHLSQTTGGGLLENLVSDFLKRTESETKLEKSKNGTADIFAWSIDGQNKIFGATEGSVVYLANDAGLIEKCLAVKRGDTESLAANELLGRKRSTAMESSAFIYGRVNQEGVAQLSNIAGVSLAMDSGDEDIVRSFVAKIVPAVFQKTTQSISWSSKRVDNKVEDSVLAEFDAETAAVVRETISPAESADAQLVRHIPPGFDSLTLYRLKNPQIAWRSVLLLASKKVDPASAKMLAAGANLFFEPYGIKDGETFLSLVSGNIVTIRMDREGERSVVAASVKDPDKAKQLVAGIDFKSEPEKVGGFELWPSADGESAAAFAGQLLFLGQKDAVRSCLIATESEYPEKKELEKIWAVNAPVITYSSDAESEERIADLFGLEAQEKKNKDRSYRVESRFSATGYERKTTSDTGLLGDLVILALSE